jgi:glucokinase
MTQPAPGLITGPTGAIRLGLDLGGSTVRAVATGPDGVRHRATVRHTARGYPAVLALLEQVVSQSREAVSPDPVQAVGLAVAGWLSADREQLIAAANLGVAGVPLRRDLEQRIGLPVTVDNDGNAAALAEARAGAGQQARMLVMLTLGTGVGGGIVASGTLLTGAAGLAGELGHLPSENNGPVCACGGRGCLEVYASGPAVARAAARRGLAAPGGGNPTAEDVVTAARAGAPEAIAALAGAGQAVGQALARLVPVLNPDLVLLGGGLATGATDLILIPARRALAEATPLSNVVAAPPVSLATGGADAGALGASYLPDMNAPRTPAGAAR